MNNKSRNWVFFLISLIGVGSIILSRLKVTCSSTPMTPEEKESLKLKTLEMFNHAYGAYKDNAFPADELMPLSCKGRYRGGSEVDRGDIDEALGNFSLTLIDALDTLALLGNLDEFETQVKYVIMNVSFNADAVVSVFETNIRILGGLLGAHSMAVSLKDSGKAMLWYQGELLLKAIDIADRLLPAFNTSTGIPYPKINLRYGVHNPNSRVGGETDTCTACAGTMIMEFGALSRMTGKNIYEIKARKAMEALWKYRSRHSDLVGTTINIHNGDWTRRDSGAGAGIDSYYEYCLKAYILLGDDSYLEKFNRHYSAIKKYLLRGFMFVDVLMHQPDQQIRSHVDSLQAFWPGLQVLKGDLKSAIEMHEILYTVSKKYKFLPEAFTTNYEVHWGQHPLRPEFVESTYFLYQATKDPYYLEVGKHVIQSMEEHARVPCGYAALSDLRTLSHEDKMDSFVLAETFKYLYLLFSEEVEHVINIHNYIFTTEAHLLPLSLSVVPRSDNETKSSEKRISLRKNEEDHTSCPRPTHQSFGELKSFAEFTRQKVTSAVEKKTTDNPTNPYCIPTPTVDFASLVQKTTKTFLLQLDLKRPRKLKAEEFEVTNEKHVSILKELGITLSKENNGKVQLVHQAVLATSPDDAQEGIKFMQEMVQLTKTKGELQTRVVQILSSPFNGNTVLPAGSAQFGPDLSQNEMVVSGETIEADPFNACQLVKNGNHFHNRIVLIQRGECMFIDKVRLAQGLGALGVIIIDHTEGSSAENSQAFGMSGDSNPSDVFIPSVFLFTKEGNLLRKYMRDEGGQVEVRLAAKSVKAENIKFVKEATDKDFKKKEATKSSIYNETSFKEPGITTNQNAADESGNVGIDNPSKESVHKSNEKDDVSASNSDSKDVNVDKDSKILLIQDDNVDPNNYLKTIKRLINLLPKNNVGDHINIIIADTAKGGNNDKDSKIPLKDDNVDHRSVNNYLKTIKSLINLLPKKKEGSNDNTVISETQRSRTNYLKAIKHLVNVLPKNKVTDNEINNVISGILKGGNVLPKNKVSDNDINNVISGILKGRNNDIVLKRPLKDDNVDHNIPLINNLNAIKHDSILTNEDVTNYINRIVSRTLKEKTTTQSKATKDEIIKCGFQGCSIIEEQMKSINDITTGILEHIRKISAVEETGEMEEPEEQQNQSDDAVEGNGEKNENKGMYNSNNNVKKEENNGKVVNEETDNSDGNNVDIMGDESENSGTETRSSSNKDMPRTKSGL